MEQVPRYLASTITSLSDKFHSEDFVEQGRHRSRQFTPRSLFLTISQLVGSTSNEGYDHALIKVFGFDRAPTKAALSQFRNQISYKFFSSIFSKTIKNFDKHRPTYNGLIVYAVDGWQFSLPRSESIVNAGFTGRAVSKYRESYLPKGFITHAYEVLSETTKKFVLNNSATELADALSFISDFEKNSLTLYDRAYFSEALCLEHFAAGNYFLARCRSNANTTVSEFFDNTEKGISSRYYDSKNGKKKVWFLKVENPNSTNHICNKPASSMAKSKNI